MTPRFEQTYAAALPELSLAWEAAPFSAPATAALDEALAAELGFDAPRLRTPEGAAFLTGQTPPGPTYAQAYAGHQFGGYSPRLGDGRALLLGEVVTPAGRRDLHLKGSGRTPFSRGGDGLAVLGPMLREHLVSAAMHALGIPTTRSLAVCTTGERVFRDGRMLPGAVLARVASSHLRVGTFQYAAATGGPDLVRRLADHAIDRHHPGARDAANPYLDLFRRVCAAQAELVAAWMGVGFVHGVMNTDNTTISGETIDYGPCAFLDAYDPGAVFSSIDTGGRYAYGHQPGVAQWNLARLAEALLPLVDDDPNAAVEAATDALSGFATAYDTAAMRVMAAKFGLVGVSGEGAVGGVEGGASGAAGSGRVAAGVGTSGADERGGSGRPGGAGTDDEPRDLEAVRGVVDDGFALLRADRVDMTIFFRRLADGTARELFTDTDGFDAWAARRESLLPTDRANVAAAMNRVNPVYVPRNHALDGALSAAEAGDLAPFERLLDAVTHPFDERADLADLAAPAPAGSGPFVTYCGT